jgi:soluble lytic murein transglycosylase-like protein
MSPEEVARLQQQQAGTSPVIGMSQYEFQSLTPAQKFRRLQMENDRRRAATLAAASGKVPAFAADIPAAFYQGATTLLEQGANAIGIPRFGRALGIYDPDVTRVEIPKFSSATPNYDKIRQIEIDNLPLTEAQFLEQLKEQDTKKIKQMQERQTKEKQTAPTKPNKTALSYDNKVTPYDALIQQSAIQYGIDPVVFKRLLGTESSFNPTAVSPRGEKYGLGIAQIASSHGLSREQRLDPNVAIPAGAQIFAAMLKQAGGNYELALQRYKGASSEKGKAAMAGPISIILSGLVPSAQAAPPPATAVRPGGNMTYAQIAALEADPLALKATPPAAAAPAAAAAAAAPAAAAPAAAAPAAAAPAAAAAPEILEVPTNKARNMEMAEYYLGDPESIPYEIQQLNQVAQQQAAVLTQRRNDAARLQQIYGSGGTAAGLKAAEEMQNTIDKFDDALLGLQQQVTQKQLYLQGMQGLRELAIANDPRRLAGVLSQTLGVPVGIQPRPDGLYNYFVNGKKTRDGISPGQLAEMALRDFNPEARAAAAASAALENELALKLKYDPQRDTAKYKAAAELQKAIIDGEYKLAEERAKQLGGKLTVDTSSGFAYFTRGREVFVINPADTKEEIGGQTITIGPRARPIGGLNTGR